MIRLTPIRRSLAAIACLSIAQCGGKTDSSKVDFNVIPDSPIVITADTTVNGTTVTAPWFKFKMTVTNNASQTLTIVALTANIYAPNSTTPTTWAIDPTAFSTNTNSASTICNYVDFGQFAPGTTTAPSLADANVGTGCTQPTLYFLVGSLPPIPTGSQNYTYRVDLTPVGWFGSDDNIQRFDRTVTFYTR